MDKSDSNSKYIALGSAALLFGGIIGWNYLKNNDSSKNKRDKLTYKYPNKEDHQKRREILKGHPDYNIFLSFTEDEELFSMRVRITFEVEKLDELFLDFMKKGITELKVNDKSILNKKDKNLFGCNRIWIASKYLKLGENTIETIAKVNFNTSDNGIMHRNGYVKIYGGFNNIAEIIPSFNQNDIRAKFRLTVSHPKSWTVISNQKASKNTDSIVNFIDSKFYKQFLKETEEMKDEIKLTTFLKTKLLPVYSLAFCGGEFSKFQSKSKYRRIRPVFYYPNDFSLPNLDSIFERMGKIQTFTLDYMTKMTGVRYPFAKCDNVFGYFSGYAWEYPGCITYSMDYLTNCNDGNFDLTQLYTLVVHETIHMWFGNMVTCQEWDQAFLHEGLVNYLETIVYSEFCKKNVDEKSAFGDQLMSTLSFYQAYLMDVYVKKDDQYDMGRAVYEPVSKKKRIFPNAMFLSLIHI